MSALFDTISNAIEGHFRGGQGKVIQDDSVPGFFPGHDLFDVGSAAQGRFECEGFSFFDALSYFQQHEFACRDIRLLRSEWRKARCDEVRVEIVDAGALFRQEVTGKGRFTGAIRSGDDETGFLRFHSIVRFDIGANGNYSR